jgi:branched-chain amino acid transport system ATP-binding protein
MPPDAPDAASGDGRQVPVLELSGVRAAYGRIEVLHGVDFAIPPASVFALLGPNGAGKSTTLKVVSGQMQPTAGQVRMMGRPVAGASTEALARTGVCTIPEGRGIFPSLTVRENLRMVTYGRVALSAVEERAYTQFPRLKERRRQVAGTLSGGEQQMLAMARALTTNPALLLLDELSMGLAPLIVEQLFELVAQIAAGGISILIVEQFAATVLEVANLAGLMLHGRVQQVGTPAELHDVLSGAYLGGAET